MAELALTDTTQPTPTDGDAWLVQQAQRRPAAFARLCRRYVGPVHLHGEGDPPQAGGDQP